MMARMKWGLPSVKIVLYAGLGVGAFLLGCDTSPVAPPAWVEGALGEAPDHPGAAFVPACEANFTAASREPGDVTTVVMHTVQGSYGGAISWFANCSAGVSAHYVISAEGDVTQSVMEQHIAWHAGHWDTNALSVGIEHEGFVDDPEAYTEAMRDASAALTASLCFRHGIPPDRAHLIGHVEVPGCPYSGGGAGCHTDPGDYWDWDDYLARVEAHLALLETGDPPEDPKEEPPVSPDTPGRLMGTVVSGEDPDGVGLSGASVALASGSTIGTTADGFFAFDDVSPGWVSVTASAPGHGSLTLEKEILPGVDAWVDFVLVPSDLELGEESGGDGDGVVDLSSFFDENGTDGNLDSSRSTGGSEASGGCSTGGPRPADPTHRHALIALLLGAGIGWRRWTRGSMAGVS